MNNILIKLNKVYGIKDKFKFILLLFSVLYIISLSFYIYYYENNIYYNLLISFLSLFPLFVFLQFKANKIPNWILNGLSFFCLLFPWSLAIYTLDKDKLIAFSSLTLMIAFIAGIVSEYILKK